jgi:hypothetical protein
MKNSGSKSKEAKQQKHGAKSEDRERENNKSSKKMQSALNFLPEVSECIFQRTCLGDIFWYDATDKL